MRSNVGIACVAVSPLTLMDRYFTEIGLGVNPGGLRRARLPEVARLAALSDVELSRRGLSRDTIVAHVFRDLLGG